MIVRMSMVEIVGPKETFLEAVSIIRDLGIFQLEPELKGYVVSGDEAGLKVMLPDKQSMAERLLLEDLRLKIDELSAVLPDIEPRTCYLDPATVLDAVAALIDKHVSFCSIKAHRRNELRKEEEELTRYSAFLSVLEKLMAGVEGWSCVDYIGLTISDAAEIEHLRQLVDRLTGGRFEILTAESPDGSVIVLLVLDCSSVAKVKESLADERLPELVFPKSFAGLTFAGKVGYLRQRLDALASEIRAIESELDGFARHWLPLYHSVRSWLDSRLMLLRTTASVHETDMCFFVHGWVPSTEVSRLGISLNERFSGTVVVTEKRIIEENLERVPVILKNSPYVRPFQLLVRLLPLPRYTSFDPTPFIATFFPLFFGMMLGDAGHGLVILVISLVCIRLFRKGSIIPDAARILAISSVYGMFFGILYGEYFGDFGMEHFGAMPLLVDRRTAIMPMLFFAIGVGVMHVLFGLLLGAGRAMRAKSGKEAIHKLMNVLIILSIAVLGLSLLTGQGTVLVRPVLITLAASIPILLLTGGLLAPLELMKNIGNIISYARIMAIGMTSVFLASMANRLAGMTGDLVVGTVVAALLHAFSIIIGVFAPTVHSLRLHYVEFFSKFLEHGGRRFEPLRK